jgi:hypothetical protein
MNRFFAAGLSAIYRALHTFGSFDRGTGAVGTPTALLILTCRNDQLCFLAAFFRNTLTFPVFSVHFTEIFGVKPKKFAQTSRKLGNRRNPQA